MSEKENVITHLQIMNAWASFALDHDVNFFNEKHLEDIVEWTDEVLTFIKEQDDNFLYWSDKYDEIGKQYTKVRDERDALMKKQKQINIATHHIDGFGNRITYCPSCNTLMRYEFNKNYCGSCGQAVKWDG